MSSCEPYLDRSNNVILYSNETLIEIRKSTGYEHKFLELLTILKACFLFIESNASGHVTGKWEIREGYPFREYDALDRALSDTTNSNFGFDESLQKLYGGASEKSFTDIAAQSLIDCKNMLNTALQDARSELSEKDFKILTLHFEDLKSQMSVVAGEMGDLFDKSMGENNLASWEGSIGIGPSELNNIVPPKVVEKIWQMFTPKLPKEATFEKLFGLTAQY